MAVLLHFEAVKLIPLYNIHEHHKHSLLCMADQHLGCTVFFNLCKIVTLKFTHFFIHLFLYHLWLCIEPMLCSICHHEHHRLVWDPHQLRQPLWVHSHYVRHWSSWEGFGAFGLWSSKTKHSWWGLEMGKKREKLIKYSCYKLWDKLIQYF